MLYILVLQCTPKQKRRSCEPSSGLYGDWFFGWYDMQLRNVPVITGTSRLASPGPVLVVRLRCVLKKAFVQTLHSQINN